MKKIIILLTLLHCMSCQKSLTGFYKIKESNVDRLSMRLNLKPDGQHTFWIMHHGVSDSIWGNWIVSNDTLYLSDNRGYRKKDITITEEVDDSIQGSIVEIRSKSEDIDKQWTDVNINSKGMITDKYGRVFLPFKVATVKINPLSVGFDTTYYVKNGNKIKIEYVPTELRVRFELEDKWLIQKHKLKAVYNNDTKIILKKM
jgi:hypothetical protein